jgi:uncharacterized protein (DUF58 family)
MLTSRGWLFLIFTILLLAFAMLDWVVLPMVGVPWPDYPNTTLELIGLTVLGWFCWEWLLFALRARVLVRRLRLERTLGDSHGSVETLWARRAIEVRLRLVLDAGLRLPYIRISEQLPLGAELHEGDIFYEGAIDAGEAVELHYRMACTALGLLRFEGVRVQIADPQGFFYHSTFLAQQDLYRVLPPLADDKGGQPTLKRFNLLPPPGVHRLRQPGTGSELLDLRDYLPGDPPKTIAWKASARRDRLITKEFESEVPLRCTLFVDTSMSVRRGEPGKNAMTRLIEIAASVAQANSANRDLTGLCVFDDQKLSYVRPARGARHLADLINRLTDAAGLDTLSTQDEVADLLPPAFAFAEKVYPDLLQPAVNHYPEWLTWVFPQPAYTLRRPTFADHVYQRLPSLLIVYLAAAFMVMLMAFGASFALGRAGYGGDPGMFVGLVGIFMALLALLLFKLPSSLFAQRRRVQRQRKLMAALLSVRYGLAPGGLSLLMEDETLFIAYLQRFLGEHRVPVPSVGRDELGRPRFRSPRKLEVLADALVRALSKEHDNELFVLLVDLVDLADDLEPLLKAVKITVARHHQVMLVLPWPRGVPVPDVREPAPIIDLVRDAESPIRRLLQEGFRNIRRTFARLGVPVITTTANEPASVILGRLERLRMVGGKR